MLFTLFALGQVLVPEATNIVWVNEDAKEGLANIINVKKTVFKGR